MILTLEKPRGAGGGGGLFFVENRGAMWIKWKKN
jgi:hypothetical protein